MAVLMRQARKVPLLAAVVATSASPCHIPYSKVSNTSADVPKACAKAPILSVSVIGCIVSFTLLHAFQQLFNSLDSKANGAFGRAALKSLTAWVGHAGVIGGIVSFTLLHAFQWGLDYLSSKTNGAFGRTAPAIQAPGHGAANPKDSAHNPQGNGKAAALDEEVCFVLLVHHESNWDTQSRCAI